MLCKEYGVERTSNKQFLGTRFVNMKRAFLTSFVVIVVGLNIVGHSLQLA